MKTKTLLVCTSLLTSLFSLVAARESLACSGGCYEGAFLPSQKDVPASIPGIFWNARLGGNLPLPSDVTLYQVTAMGKVSVPFTATQYNQNVNQLVLVPNEPLLPNTDYELVDSVSCIPGNTPIQTTFHTTDALPFPKTLGTLIVRLPTLSAIDLSSPEGSCSTRIMTLNSQVALVPSIEAEPFAHAFYYETIVDGKLWQPSHNILDINPPGASWEGRGQDLLYTMCDFEAQSGIGTPLAEGEHTVVIRAKLQGSDFVIDSEPATVTLNCPEMADESKPIIESPGCQLNASGFGGAYRGWLTISLAMGVFMAWRRRRLQP